MNYALFGGRISNCHSIAALKPAFINVVQHNAKLSRWDPSGEGRAGIKQVFDNQALNTLFNYGARGTEYVVQLVDRDYKKYPLPSDTRWQIAALPASQMVEPQDIFVTDPPYGDAVKYEEILEFFIAWLRKNPPREFADWVWDSRRSLAIKGEDEGFRRNMVAAYKRMTECMPANGIQVIMFTHLWLHLGRHGQYRLGLRPASHRSLVRGYRDRQRATRGQLC